MRVWRICSAKHLAQAFDGRGAELHGGRWNHPGVRMVYTSSTLSLASLELFVHVDPATLPADLHWVSVEIPASVSQAVLAAASLPPNWRDYPAPDALRDMGSRWLREMRSLLLIVPSAVNPEENNILINPLHSEFGALANIRSKPFTFDPRMWKAGKP